jgi:hypothetical protein
MILKIIFNINFMDPTGLRYKGTSDGGRVDDHEPHGMVLAQTALLGEVGPASAPILSGSGHGPRLTTPEDVCTMDSKLLIRENKAATPKQIVAFDA